MPKTEVICSCGKVGEAEIPCPHARSNGLDRFCRDCGCNFHTGDSKIKQACEEMIEYMKLKTPDIVLNPRSEDYGNGEKLKGYNIAIGRGQEYLKKM